MALFALLFQISAVDHHWHPDSASIEGQVGTSNHTLHCHGAVSGCANGGAEMPSALRSPTELPSGTLPVLLSSLEDAAQPAETFVAVNTEPPRL